MTQTTTPALSPTTSAYSIANSPESPLGSFQQEIPMGELMQDAAIMYRMPCVSCGKISDFSFGSSCQHRSKKERLCGWKMPTRLDEMNKDMLEWISKHTNQPTGQFDGLISYASSTGAYLNDRLKVAACGDIYFDQRYNDFCLYLAPSGTRSIATVCSGSSNMFTSASGIKMIVNSSAQNLHHHYANYDEKMIPICKPVDVIIEPRNQTHPAECLVLSGGKEIARWNSKSNNLLIYSPAF